MKDLVFIILSVFLFGSCSKKAEDPPPTKTELLTQSSWKFSKATVGGTDVSGLLQPCDKDNIYTFASAGTGTMDQGLLKCNIGDPQTNPFTWAWQSGETVLQISTVLFPGGSNTFSVKSLTGAQMVLTQNITVGGTTQNAEVTFVH